LDLARRSSDPAMLVLQRRIRRGQQGRWRETQIQTQFGPQAFLFFCFLFDLSRQAFELSWERPIYYDLWTEAVVMPASVNPFSPSPKKTLCSSDAKMVINNKVVVKSAVYN
jgi:hypothetical protein